MRGHPFTRLRLMDTVCSTNVLWVDLSLSGTYPVSALFNSRVVVDMKSPCPGLQKPLGNNQRPYALVSTTE
jgi:hypothetical protein